MTDFLLELRSEEIPARMQVKAKDDLARLFAEEIAKAGLKARSIETFATSRRLALIAHGLPDQTEAVSEEIKGPNSSAPPQALDGFLRKTGLTREQLVERDGVFFAVIEKPGRATADVLAEPVPAIVRAFPWPKSMRWGTASASTESLRWVRPLQGIVALLDDAIVPIEVDGVISGRETMGHRFHHNGPVEIANAASYAENLRAAHVMLHLSERSAIIRDGAARLAAEAGLVLVEDEGLVLENAGLTEWPVPLLGRFDPAFLNVPPEVIQLTARVNQKYFVMKSSPSSLGEGDRPQDGGGALAPNFICVANIDASDGGKAIVAGNERVLSARLSDAKFFWDNDLKVPLEAQAEKLKDIVFHEKLGTVADKVERVAKLARWLCEEGIIKREEERGLRQAQPSRVENDVPQTDLPELVEGPSFSLADLAERAAHLCKADLVTGMVGEFPELQGVIGGYLAAAQGENPQVAAAIRDHYKPVGQGDDVPTDPVTVAVSLADKLDTLFAFYLIEERPTGSKDPFALRRAVLGILSINSESELHLPLRNSAFEWVKIASQSYLNRVIAGIVALGAVTTAEKEIADVTSKVKEADPNAVLDILRAARIDFVDPVFEAITPRIASIFRGESDFFDQILAFFADRLKVQQREAGVRHDLIDAVFALGGEDDLVRLLARVKALQVFVTTGEGANLLAGYKRAANILKKVGASPSPSGERATREASGERASPGDVKSPHPAHAARESTLSPEGEGAESALIAALDLAEPQAAAAIAGEDFETAMSALASLRAPIDQFFETVTVNDPDPAKRAARLALLARVRDAVHTVADFSKIEG